MKRNEYYVYRFLDINNRVIYVGKTSTDLRIRMRNHFSQSGHLSEECLATVSKIEYIELNSKTDMDLREFYYINKYNPEFNIQDKNQEDNIETELKELEWRMYKDITEEDYLRLEQENKALKKLTELNEKKLKEKDRQIELLTLSLDYKNVNSPKDINLDDSRFEINIDFVKEILKKSQPYEVKFIRDKYINGIIVSKIEIYKNENNELIAYNQLEDIYENIDEWTYLDSKESYKYYTDNPIAYLYLYDITNVSLSSEDVSEYIGVRNNKSHFFRDKENRFNLAIDIHGVANIYDLLKNKNSIINKEYIDECNKIITKDSFLKEFKSIIWSHCYLDLIKKDMEVNPYIRTLLNNHKS